MRIGHVKTSSLKRKYIEDDIDRLNNKVRCLDCGKNRKTLESLTNPNIIMKVCINKQCFHYTDLSKIPSWIPEVVD